MLLNKYVPIPYHPAFKRYSKVEGLLWGHCFGVVVDAALYCWFRANLDGQGSQTLSISRGPDPIGASCHMGFEFTSPEALDACADFVQRRGISQSE